MKYSVILPLVLAILFISCQSKEASEPMFKSFIGEHLKIVEPKFKALNLANWNASATGEQKFYEESAKIELELRTIYSSKSDFEKIKKFKEDGQIKDPLLQRQLVVLYNSYLGNQIDTTLMRQIVEKGAVIAQRFNTFRGKIDGKEVSDNDIHNILRTETKSEKRKKGWEASKQVGKEVAPLVVELVKLRNEAARKLGFENYYQMSLALGEQDEKEILAIFDELKKFTDEPFKKVKGEIDAELSKRYGADPSKMYPWFYQDPFFQEAPSVGEVDLNKFYKGKDIVELSRKFYSTIGLSVDDILKNSDLYPRKGKYQHAFCTDIDRLGDVRTMQNVKDDYYWMGTMLHELGHGVYSKNIDRTLPFLLRSEAHTFTTEAIAMLMERQASNVEWIGTMVGIDAKEKESVRKTVKANLRMKVLLFSRWSQVMIRFEQSMYRNPDQNLNKLWWDLVEEYQLVKRPEGRNEPDWAAKIHLAQYPAYYHNYTLGELTASQLLNYITTNTFKGERDMSFVGKSEIGKYLQEKVFAPGMKYRWDEFVKQATGEPLSSKFFVQEFVE